MAAATPLPAILTAEVSEEFHEEGGENEFIHGNLNVPVYNFTLAETIDLFNEMKKMPAGDDQEVKSSECDHPNSPQNSPTSLDCHDFPPIKNDVISCIQSGSNVACGASDYGKSADLLPLINILLSKERQGIRERCLKPEMIIIALNGVLARQMFNFTQTSHGSSLKTAVIYADTSEDQRREKLQAGCTILIATVGCFQGLIDDRFMDFSHVEFLMLDGADSMVNMGLKEKINKLYTHMPPPGKCQILFLISMETTSQIQDLAKHMIGDREVNVTNELSSKLAKLSHVDELKSTSPVQGDVVVTSKTLRCGTKDGQGGVSGYESNE